MVDDGTKMRPDGTWYPKPSPLEIKVRELEERLAGLEARLARSGIHSHSLWRRAWTVFGYAFFTFCVVGVGLLLLFALAR